MPRAACLCVLREAYELDRFLYGWTFVLSFKPEPSPRGDCICKISRDCVATEGNCGPETFRRNSWDENAEKFANAIATRAMVPVNDKNNVQPLQNPIEVPYASRQKHINTARRRIMVASSEQTQRASIVSKPAKAHARQEPAWCSAQSRRFCEWINQCRAIMTRSRSSSRRPSERHRTSRMAAAD